MALPHLAGPSSHDAQHRFTHRIPSPGPDDDSHSQTDEQEANGGLFQSGKWYGNSASGSIAPSTVLEQVRWFHLWRCWACVIEQFYYSSCRMLSCPAQVVLPLNDLMAVINRFMTENLVARMAYRMHLILLHTTWRRPQRTDSKHLYKNVVSHHIKSLSCCRSYLHRDTQRSLSTSTSNTCMSQYIFQELLHTDYGISGLETGRDTLSPKKNFALRSHLSHNMEPRESAPPTPTTSGFYPSFSSSLPYPQD
jgi:hypothetical protein